LWLLFHLESERLTIAPAGPGFCRYRMWLNWQADTDLVLGTYEPTVAAVLRREITPGSLCLDIGAHLGYYAILMARLTGNNGVVVAFEPVPENFAMLQKNLALNALANVHYEPLAVSAEDGTLRLAIACDGEFPKTASRSGFAVGKGRKALDVATCSVDTYLTRTGNDPDLLLIDVERAELDVLKGAQATLRRARPKLVIELHGWDTPERDEVGKFLSRFGYQGTILGHRNREAFGFFRPSQKPIESPSE
jgi:FkbM family methyltransferase